ncbi:MAG TPA: phytanoyl-CoA dioxygenase family protein [Fimbriimonas sp.]|nr:phytanoyl-CoA dioxygenase family protein [Fimbriimonas sp.]
MPYKIDGAASGPVEMHAPDLYRADETTVPLGSLDDLTVEAIQTYRQDGFLAVANVFSAAEVDAAREGLAHLVAGGNPTYDDIYYERFAAERLDDLSAQERIDAVRKLAYYVEFEPRLKALSHHPKILRAVQTLIGGSDPWMFQDMGMLKPPGGREKPWHQDKAYFDFPVDTPVVGVWVALDPVGPENGCMFVLKGAHRLGPVIHFNRRDWQICDTDIRRLNDGWKSVAVPLEPGGILFFDGLLPHGTPTNRTQSRRRALQFHYAPSHTQKVSTEERMELFGSEGKDVSC